MILEWKQYSIHLGEFNDFLKENCPNADGIIANPDNFEIIEKNPLTQYEIDLINSYYDSLSQSGEQYKFDFENNFLTALNSYREDAIFNNLTNLQKKAVFRLQLTKAEEYTIYEWYIN